MERSGAVMIVTLTAIVLWIGYVSFSKEPEARIVVGSLPCLTEEDLDLAPYQAHLRILVDDIEDPLPSGIGVRASCEAQARTLDASGTITIITPDPKRRVTLRNFFNIWGVPLERAGYELSVTVNGAPTNANGDLILKDGYEVVLSYVSDYAKAHATTTDPDSVFDILPAAAPKKTGPRTLQPY